MQLSSFAYKLAFFVISNGATISQLFLLLKQ